MLSLAGILAGLLSPGKDTASLSAFSLKIRACVVFRHIRNQSRPGDPHLGELVPSTQSSVDGQESRNSALHALFSEHLALAWQPLVLLPRFSEHPALSCRADSFYQGSSEILALHCRPQGTDAPAVEYTQLHPGICSRISTNWVNHL